MLAGWLALDSDGAALPCPLRGRLIFLEADLAQIESKLVFLMTQDPELVELALRPSWEWDGHTANAVMLFGPDVTEKEDFKKYRHVGKITSHGAQRDMRGDRLSGSILKEVGLTFSAEKCNQLIEKYHGRYPAIRAKYFREIRKLVMRDKMLVNSWGRRIDFRYDRLDDELFRQAYSFLPQSEASDILIQRGLIPLHYYLAALVQRPANVTVHDSLLCSVKPEDAYDVATFLNANLTKPVMIAGTLFRPEVGFKLGINWSANEKRGEGVEYKRLPSRQEFTEKAHGLDISNR